MLRPEEQKRRFEAAKARLEALRSRLGAGEGGATVVVDVADLDSKCRRYQEAVDKLILLPSMPEVDEALGELLVEIGVAAEDLKECCVDLKGPLDGLVSTVYERLPEDSDAADDLR